MLEFLMMQPRISSQKVNLYKIRCRFWKSMKVTSRMMQDNKRKGSTQCSILENVFLYLIIDLYFIFFIILSFAFSFPCFIFSFG
uniref:Ovule protein n=1 Tax=Strongyloides stercoralis TaxID=6248 RepID=A0A0K0EF22_STRER